MTETPLLNSGVLPGTIPVTNQTKLCLNKKINLQHDMTLHKLKGLLPLVAYQEVTK
jgi:hypothetical protein